MQLDAVFDTGHSAPVTDTAVDAAGKRLASCGEDGVIRIFAINNESPDKWDLLAVLEGHTGTVVSVSWAPPAHYASTLLSCGEDFQVILWSDFGNAKGWAKVYFTTLASVPWCVAWAPHEYGKMFAVGCASGSVMIFVGKDQQWSHTEFTAHPNGCSSLSWAPSLPPGMLLMAPLESESTASGAHPPAGMPLAPPRIVTCGGDRSVTVWTLCGEEWRPQELPLEVEASWREVAWAPGVGMPFTYIAAGSDEGFVVVWSQDGSARGEWNRMVLPQQEDGVTKLSWSLVGTFLLVSCANGTASMWQECASSQGWERACELLPSGN
ncbi:putative protein transport protein SEC13 [Trypanosoma cruzi]|uniref:Protein transport protein sec13, putative n=2 Tax=Trypanosoma cruzi TaxID=5693 RepID=Q4DMJ0_TRYCC|nr:protein transport protein sec13, putative [Trypanosoma cruzi]EAN93751.1 protein transport protein sec13, putative [Trypanosoma cruzi]KAF5222126.1 hypothetical protein ECC02_004880 [Trypanosoma cruzi]PWV19426.1 putative protein transport protein SEC13 [Trypanosoma cruzi]RNC44352.1 putative protein transport protein Sec13 [Trypanosoma cruzi]|eukprot:XP_815602.1 protein transport protein sec13 [Trypanosoma cruzi strain CL Brener]